MLDRGFITYSNQAKQDMLGVSADTLKRHGAVSRETAEAMARGALARARSISPSRSPALPGPMAATTKSRSDSCISRPRRAPDNLRHEERRFGNIGRAEVRKRSVLQAFVMLHDLAEQEPARS